MRALIVVCVLGLAGCGSSSSSPLCGAGTRLEGSACVVDLSLVCGVGTTRGAGQCLAASSSGLQCGPGTVQAGTQCVPVASGDAGVMMCPAPDAGTCPACPGCPTIDAGVTTCPTPDAGVCPFRPESGVPYCSSSSDCLSSQSCRDRGDGVRVCMGGGTNGDYCTSSFDCVSSLDCRAWAGLEVCVGDGVSGDPCASSLDCGSSLFCRDVGNGVRLCR